MAKKKDKIKLELTAEEWSVLNSVVSSAQECMEWDDDTQTYTDGGRFILSLEKDEYETLMKLNI